MDTVKPTASLFLDTRRAKSNNTYPVKLTIYFAGDKKRYPTKIDLTEGDWNRLFKTNLKDDNLKVLRRKLEALKQKGESVISGLSPFSFAAFEEAFFHEKKVRQSADLAALFDDYIEALTGKDRVGTAASYRSTKNSILSFKTKLRLTDITPKFLEDYEKHMLSRKISPSTIGIYLRQLRCIINVAISKGIFPQQQYPFKGYTIPSSRNIKKALTEAQIKALFHYETSNPDIRKALDLWLFSYLSNGINMTDICHLRPENISGDFFHYYRAKTKNTKKRDLRPIKVPLTERSKTIIKTWKNTDTSNPYLFPILQQGLTAAQARYKIQHLIYKINKQMQTVATDLGIEAGIGTYVARHSHATILKRKGAPSEVIKENLGHSSLLVTENYLSDFTDEIKKDYAKLLTDF